MKKIPTVKDLIDKIDEDFYAKHSFYLSVSSPVLFAETVAIEFAKLHVEAALKEMEQKLLDTLDDMNYLEENVCGVIEEIRGYKSDNIK